jgi:hypothetical protein
MLPTIIEGSKLPANPEQLRIASLLGVCIDGDSESVAAARIEDAVASAIFPNHTAGPATESQINFGCALGLELSGLTKRVASAMIDDELQRRNAEALERLDLKPGDRVIKRREFSFGGQMHVLEDEHVVSSVGENTMRVYFRGGNGKGAWPTELTRIED